MKNLEEMKAKFEKELAFATKENEMEERFGCGFFVYERIKASGLHIVAKSDEMQVAKALLVAYPADEEQALDATAKNSQGTVFGLYHVYANRGYSGICTKLQVRWLHKGDEYHFELQIDGNDTLEQFFYNDRRKMSSSECSTYKPTRGDRLVYDMDLPIKRFQAAHISYSGGYLSCTDTDEINNIINAIINA